MLYITLPEIKAIIPTQMSDSDIEEYMESASVLLDSWFKGVSVTEELMKELQRWITAHLMAMSRDRQAKEQGAGGAYVKYGGVQGTGLRGTSYGQTAIEIDTTGTLRRISGKAVVFFAVKEGGK